MLKSGSVWRAALWLDFVAPGWFYQINPATLNISMCSVCIFGQAFGADTIKKFDEKLRELVGLDPEGGLEDDKWVRDSTSPVGFNLMVFHMNSYKPQWLQVIRQRQMAALLEAHNHEQRALAQADGDHG